MKLAILNSWIGDLFLAYNSNMVVILKTISSVLQRYIFMIWICSCWLISPRLRRSWCWRRRVWLDRTQPACACASSGSWGSITRVSSSPRNRRRLPSKGINLVQNSVFLDLLLELMIQWYKCVYYYYYCCCWKLNREKLCSTFCIDGFVSEIQVPATDISSSQNIFHITNQLPAIEPHKRI